MDREVVLSAALVFLLAVILFTCWLHACGRWKQRGAEELTGHDMDIFIPEVDNEEGAARAAASWKGLDKVTLEALPTFVYRRKDYHSHGSSLKEQAMRGDRSSRQVECPICLSEFKEEERGRVLPNCSHCFHVECIDTWLLANGTCPVCRASCGADVTVQVQVHAPSSMGAVGVQYPTNVLFWGSNSVLASSGASLDQMATIQVITPPPPPPPLDSASSSSSASPFSRLNPLRRLLSRERIHTCSVLYSKI